MATSQSFFQPWVELSRINKFAGTMLIFWPCAWGLTMSAFSLSLPLPQYFVGLVYSLVGVALFHSAGCIWNDILDREFDRQVERTKRRPIADRRISVPGALIFLSMHLVALVALLLPFNGLARNLGLFAVFPLAGIYPLLKRITYWPQAWLGVALNIVTLVSWSALRSNLVTAPYVLMLGSWFWTLYYDTIYACQDKCDDVKAGVKSTALLFGSYIKIMLALFAASIVACLFAAGIMNEHGLSFLLIGILGAAANLYHQLSALNVDEPKSCLRAFEANGFKLGGIVWLGLFVDYLLA